MKNTKKNSVMKKILPSACMLAVSAAMLSTSTYAWFSMNTTVTAQGMHMTAKAEEGLVISNAAAGTYDVNASSVKTTVANLKPGSSANLADWYHSSSTDPNTANTQQTYDAGAAWVSNDSDANYVVHDFYIRSSAAADLTVGSLDVTGVTATVNSGAAAQNLSKSLRVGILIDGDKTSNTQNVYIYAPVSGYTSSYTVAQATGAYNASARTTVTPLSGNTPSNSTITTIPDSADNGLHVEVFVWFEGEDANCISNNIAATLEQLDVSVTFGYTASA